MSGDGWGHRSLEQAVAERTRTGNPDEFETPEQAQARVRRRRERRELQQRAERTIQAKYEERGPALGDVFPIMMADETVAFGRVSVVQVASGDVLCLIQSDANGKPLSASDSPETTGENTPDEP